MFQKEDAQKLKDLISAEYVNVYYSDLGGAHNASLMATICIEPKSEWKYGILENSNYGKFHISGKEKKIEHFSGYGMKKLRKSSFKSVEEVAEKLNKWIAESRREKQV